MFSRFVSIFLYMSMMHSKSGFFLFKNILIYFLWFFVYLSIFGYGFFDTFWNKFCSNCMGLNICCLGKFY